MKSRKFLKIVSSSQNEWCLMGDTDKLKMLSFVLEPLHPTNSPSQTRGRKSENLLDDNF